MTWTPLELAANFMTLVCIFLAGRNNVHTWWTGIVACVLFGAVFYGANLYADVLLQAFFVVTGVLGWVMWTRRGTQAVELPITTSDRTTLLGFLLLAVTVAYGYGTILKFYTDAYAPMIDSLVLTLSVTGQILLMRRKLETWYFWVVVNGLSVPLYFTRELYLTSILYSVFFFYAIWSALNWRKLVAAKVTE